MSVMRLTTATVVVFLVFHFDSEDEIGGCYHQVSADGEISDCFELTGLRFDAQKFPTGFAGKARDRSEPQESYDIDEQRAVSRFSTPSPEMANVIEKLRRLSGSASEEAFRPQ